MLGRMKLTSCRDIEPVRIADMLSVGLIDDRVSVRCLRSCLPVWKKLFRGR